MKLYNHNRVYTFNRKAKHNYMNIIENLRNNNSIYNVCDKYNKTHNKSYMDTLLLKCMYYKEDTVSLVKLCVKFIDNVSLYKLIVFIQELYRITKLMENANVNDSKDKVLLETHVVALYDLCADTLFTVIDGVQTVTDDTFLGDYYIIPSSYSRNKLVIFYNHKISEYDDNNTYIARNRYNKCNEECLLINGVICKNIITKYIINNKKDIPEKYKDKIKSYL